MDYPEIIKQHFCHPYHVGEWQPQLPNVVSAKAGTYALGVVIQFQCLIENNTIVTAQFKAYGNPYLIAAGSYMTQWLEGKTAPELENFDYKILIADLELPAKQHHCAIIIDKAIATLRRGFHE